MASNQDLDRVIDHVMLHVSVILFRKREHDKTAIY